MFLSSNTYYSSINKERETVRQGKKTERRKGRKKEKERRKGRKPSAVSPVRSTQHTTLRLKNNSSAKSSTP
jgi:hypothetical protein